MNRQIDVLIIGGGLAGLTSAIHLSRAGKQVLLIEKNSYPHHKVCGEYLSKEVLPYLQWLGADPGVLKPININKLQITTADGRSCSTTLALGGLGISRYALDEFLYQHAKVSGCTVVHDTVTDVSFDQERFTVRTTNGNYHASLVLGAYGKRSALDQKLQRGFIQSRSPWLAIKAHYTGSFANDLVALHNFKGGYCGVSKVEDNLINICYLVDYASFKSYKNIEVHKQQVLYKNAYLKQVMESSSMDFAMPISISQISFENKEKVKEHILMIGDTAGLIHPLCGNGMGMAIHSAQICCKLVLSYLEGSITSREKLERAYEEHWKDEFKWRIWMGRKLAGILRKEPYADLVMKGLVQFPQLLSPVIRMTHGKPLIAG
jgi:flavin-dependent dehydrogenase